MAITSIYGDSIDAAARTEADDEDRKARRPAASGSLRPRRKRRVVLPVVRRAVGVARRAVATGR